MKLSSKVTQLVEIIAPAVAACDVDLWGVEFVPQGRKSLLRIYIEALAEDKAQNKQVTIEDCAAVTHQVSGVLEVHDPIAGEYILEVSSPGLNRTFFSVSQMQDYIGQIISVRLIQAISTIQDDKKHHNDSNSGHSFASVQKRRKATGTLLSMDNDSLELQTSDGERLQIALANIDKANLVYQDN